MRRDELLTELGSLQTTNSEGKGKARRRARAADLETGGAESGQETDAEEGGGAGEKPYYSSMLSEDLRLLSAIN